MLELLNPPSKEGGSDWPSLGQVSTLVQSVAAGGGVLQQTGFFACCGLETGWTTPVLSLTFGETIKRTQVYLDQRDDLRNKPCALSYSPALAHPSRE